MVTTDFLCQACQIGRLNLNCQPGLPVRLPWSRSLTVPTRPLPRQINMQVQDDADKDLEDGELGSEALQASTA